MTDKAAPIVNLQQDQPAAFAHVYEGPSGTWIVQDDMDSRGGMFTNRKAAMKFVDGEFGPETKIISSAPATDAIDTDSPIPSNQQIVPHTRHRYEVHDGQVTWSKIADGSAQGDVFDGEISSKGWDEAAHAVADAANMEGSWAAAAKLLIEQSGQDAGKSSKTKSKGSNGKDQKDNTFSLASEGEGQPQNEVFEHLESNVQSYARAFPRIFNKAVGTTIWDKDGRPYIDFLAGAGSLNFGHNNPAIKSSLIEYMQSDGITHGLDFHTVAKEKFLTAMDEIILKPRGLDYVIQFTGPTGTNAVEAALKIARKVTGNTNIISFTNGFHGVSMGALSITGNETLRAAAGVPLGGATSMPYDRYMGEDVDTISYLERVLDDPSSGIDAPAAIILEIIQGEGGLNMARVEWLQSLQALCNKREIPLIVDDIQAGCGRSGTFFSFEEAGLKPDIVTLSKSLSGYGLPFSVVLIRRDLDQWSPGEHNGTFRGNNPAFITSARMLELYWKDGKFENELKKKSAHLRKRLLAMVEQHPDDLIDVKGRGFMIGVRCVDPDQAAKVTRNAFTEGLIIERCGPRDEVVKCMMPLTTTMEEMDQGLDILERVFEGMFSREAWDKNVHDISDSESLSGCWEVAAQLLITHADQTPESGTKGKTG